VQRAWGTSAWMLCKVRRGLNEDTAGIIQHLCCILAVHTRLLPQSTMQE
jgi:hypothetical protein